jgi:hypothetical protein
MYQVTYFHESFGTTTRYDVQYIYLKFTTLIMKLSEGWERETIWLQRKIQYSTALQLSETNDVIKKDNLGTYELRTEFYISVNDVMWNVNIYIVHKFYYSCM